MTVERERWNASKPPGRVQSELDEIEASGDYIGEHPAVGERQSDGTVVTWRKRGDVYEVMR